jgi:hypothetical protein
LIGESSQNNHGTIGFGRTWWHRQWSVQGKRVQRIPARDQHVLVAIHRIRLRRVHDITQLRMSERLSIGRIVGDDVAARIAREQQFARGRQDAFAPPPPVPG